MSAILPSLFFFLQHAQARTFQQGSGPAYSGQLVRINFTSVELDVYGVPLNLDMNSESPDFPTDKRCVVFRVQFVNGGMGKTMVLVR